MTSKGLMAAAVSAVLASVVGTGAAMGESWSGMMPEVEVIARAPEHVRGVMPEVEVVAEGPVILLGEVVVRAEAPDQDRVLLGAMTADEESTPTALN